jgi:acetolactate synthase-1/2/3 large subunit
VLSTLAAEAEGAGMGGMVQSRPVREGAEEDRERFVGMTGAEIFHDLMIDHGVEVVFGYPGGAILPVFDAIYESDNFKFILPRHEQGGGHMAEGYARATGKAGVVLVTSGPGATNVVTPMQDALMDGTPLVVFTGQVPTAMIGTDAFQEADVIGITRPCTKWNCLVTDIRDLPRRINEAFLVAQSGRPGPVLVDLPKDVTAGILTEPTDSRPRIGTIPRRGAHGAALPSADKTQAQIERVAAMINAAQKPVLYAGQGVLQSEGGVEALRALAVSGNVPCTTTLQGMGAFDELSPLSMHMLGMHGSAYANFAIQDADLIVALGARFDDRVTGNLAQFAPKARAAAAKGTGGIVQFEISHKQLNKTVDVTEGVLGDVAEGMRALAPLLENEPRAEWHAKINGWKEAYPFDYGEPATGDALCKGPQVVAELYRQVADRSEEVICTTGVGCHQMWAAQYYRWRTPRSFITSGGSGTMGFGVPSAIGAAIGAPDCIVVDIDGDASFSMTCQVSSSFLLFAQFCCLLIYSFSVFAQYDVPGAAHCGRI